MAGEETEWMHFLFHGGKDSLEGYPKDDYVDEFTRHKLVATTIPILEFEFKNLDQLAKQLEKKSNNGLIITSPRVVEALVRAERLLGNHNKLTSRFESDLVFVVGEKTGLECREKLYLSFNKQSAKAGNGRALAEYIRTFCKTAENISSPINLIYPKSSLSDKSIEAALANDKSSTVEVQPIVVYETRPLNDVDKILLDQIVKLSIPPKNNTVRKLLLNMIFFSPSGLNGYLESGCEKFIINQLGQENIFPNCDVIEIKYSGIGKTTEAALLRNNLKVFCVAEKPNPLSLVTSILSSYSSFKSHNSPK